MTYGTPSKSYSRRSGRTPLQHGGDGVERSPFATLVPLGGGSRSFLLFPSSRRGRGFLLFPFRRGTRGGESCFLLWDVEEEGEEDVLSFDSFDDVFEVDGGDFLVDFCTASCFTG